MKALVLSGGNIKGAFQAGAIRTVIQAGYQPDIITGISVGSLNGGFLVSRSARIVAPNPIPWPTIATDLTAFWTTEVTGPDKLLKKRGFFDIAARVFSKNWDGLANLDRLYALVEKTLPVADFANPRVRSGFGAVSIDTGGIVYSPADPGTAASVVQYIIASTQEPIGMPLYPVDGHPFCDGGVRDLAPLKRAIKLGASQIVCVACQPADVGPLGSDFNRGDAFDLVSRVLEIITNELLNGDLETLVETNQLLAEVNPTIPSLQGKRRIPLLVVRPATKIPVNITKFTPADISGMIQLGSTRATDRIREAKANQNDPGFPIAKDLTA